MQAQKRPTWVLGLGVGALLLLCAFGLLLFLDLPLRLSSQSYPLTQANHKVTYTPGGGQLGVLTVVGSPGENSKLQGVNSYLHRAGASIMAVELPTDTSIEQGADILKEAVAALRKESGLGDQDILFLGYGTGAQALLPYSQNTSMGGLCLISPILSASPTQGNMPTLILGTSTDTAPTPATLTDLYNQLSGDTIKNIGFAFRAEKGVYQLGVVSGVVDAYQAYSGTMLTHLSQWVNETYSLHTQIPGWQGPLRIAGWVVGVVGLALVLLFAYQGALGAFVDITYAMIPLRLISRPKYLAGKMVLWVTALPVLLLVLAGAYLLPLSAPLLGLLFCGYLFSYGAVRGILLRTGKMPGVTGKLESFNNPWRASRAAKGLLVAVCTQGVLLFLGSSGLFALHITPQRIGWFALFTLLCGVAFYYFYYEAALLDQAKLSYAQKLPVQSVEFLPLVALAVIALPVTSFTGSLTVALYLGALVLALLQGRLVELLSGKPSLAAVCSGILLGGFIAFGVI